MAKALELPAPSGNAPAREGSLRWLLTLGLLTLLSAAIGGGFGLVMVSGIEKQVEEQADAFPYVSRSLSVSTSSEQVEIDESTDYSLS